MILVAGLVVALGALVQGAVGYGMSLVAAPLLALVDPALVPVPFNLADNVLVGFALSGPARRVLDNGWARRVVLAVATASTMLLIGRVLLSSA